MMNPAAADPQASAVVFISQTLERQFFIWAALTALALFVSYEIWSFLPWYELHPQRYASIVAAVKSQAIAPGELKRFYLVHPWDAGSLKEGREAEDNPDIPTLRYGIGAIWAERRADGTYKIEIMTVDNGHMGAKGLYFTDSPAARYKDPYVEIDSPGPMHQVKNQISQHWWCTVIWNDLRKPAQNK
jgi:hypothetical protein